MTRWDSLPPNVRIASEIGGGKLIPKPLTVKERRAIKRTERIARDGVTDRAVVVIDHGVPTTNQMIRMHPRERERITGVFRQVGLYADGGAVEGLAVVEVYPTAGPVGGVGDAPSRSLVVKAVIDGMCDAGILIDDDPRYIAWERHHAPVRGERAGLRIEILPPCNV